MGFRVSVFLSASLILLNTGCARIADTFNSWGEAMPTHNNVRCDSWFCWGDNKKSDDSLNQGQGEQAGGAARYSPIENQQPINQPQMQEGLSGFGGGELMRDPPPGMNDGFTEAEIQNMPPELQEMMREKGMLTPPPAPPTPGMGKGPIIKKAKKDNSAYPEGMDPNNPPPGAIPGVNWPPPPPEFMNAEDDMDMQHKLPAALDAGDSGDSDNSESDE